MEPGDSTTQVIPSSPSSDNLAESSPTASDTVTASSPGTDSTPSTSSAFPMRKRLRRNPAVLIRWIEDHPFNPYPTKAEKQGLAFYAGMTQRQLNDWFANARRNIKKVGYENWKKKHNGFSAILSGIPLATSSTASNNGGSGSAATHHGLNSSFTNHPFTNTAFTISPLNRPSFSASAPCTYPSTGPMSFAAAGMGTCVKPTALQSSAAAAAGFVKLEGGSAYYGGSSYGLAPGEGSGGGGGAHLVSSSGSSSFCLSSLPFSHESYQLAAATGHTTGPLLAAVDANIRSFSTPTSAATIPYIACDQCAPSSTSVVQHHPTVLYNWASHPQPVPMGSTTMLNHVSFSGSGLMGAHTPSPPPPPTPVASPENSAQTRASENSLQQQEQENTNSPHESGYSSATSPALTTHHR
jgi:hypothetical protein